MPANSGFSYRQAGVDTDQASTGLKGLLHWVRQTHALRQDVGAVRLPIGYYANVIDLGHGTGLAISTDGVGSKLLVAQLMDKYDTVGIDCVAMNANDILCVGARPLSMVDYLAVQAPEARLLEELGKGLYEGARQANITIAGGELAQIGDMLRGVRDGYAFDLAATCVGTVPLDRILVGQDIRAGDVLIGLASTGIHSNGLTLARRVLLDQAGWRVDQYVPELGRVLGEELLAPTRIYVREVCAMLDAQLPIKALLHITGDGLLNLRRIQAEMGFVIEQLPEPQPIFRLIQARGQVSEAEMYQVFNMGVGFCLVTGPAAVETVQTIARQHGVIAYELGRAVTDPERRLWVRPKGLVSAGNTFVPAAPDPLHGEST
ncbi:MAG TPA: phosphoribosylformylglycinamidine cyclo-ligase [Candidatus Tectomicrobia bacterium]|nr:phosphoribosylformylglycinamidine cyclo-ligase [Candidatus Tectomicrobia bacterium]